MYKITYKSMMMSCLLLALPAVSAMAASFEDLSKAFIVLESSSGKKYLCAAVKIDGASYVVTSQSLFLNPVPRFRLRSFITGKFLKQTGFEVGKQEDLVRIPFEGSSGVVPLEFSGNAGSGGSVYSMNPKTGIVYYCNAGGGNLNNKNFTCAAGAPVINNKGEFVGVSSRTDNGLGKNITIGVAPCVKDEEWQGLKPGLFSKQVYSLNKLWVFTKALSFIKGKNVLNRYIEIDSDTHLKLLSWLQDQNKKSKENKLSRSKNFRMGSGVQEHKDLGLYYTNLIRLTAFFNSNSILAKKTKWNSSYLKENARNVFDVNRQSARKCKDEMKALVKLHPSLKAK